MMTDCVMPRCRRSWCRLIPEILGELSYLLVPEPTNNELRFNSISLMFYSRSVPDPKQQLAASSAEARFTIAYLRKLYDLLVQYKNCENPDMVIEILRILAEICVYGDNNSELLFEYFCEKAMLQCIIDILWIDNCTSTVRVQILQTLSILVRNVRNNTSLYYLLSNNKINEVVLYPYDFSNHESLADQFASFMKTLSLMLDPQTINFFYIENNGQFPLLSRAIDLLSSSESMIRIASQTTILNVLRVTYTHAKLFCLEKNILDRLTIALASIMCNQYTLLLRECVEYVNVSNSLAMAGDNSENTILVSLENKIASTIANSEDWMFFLQDLFGLNIAELCDAMTHFLEAIFIGPHLTKPLLSWIQHAPTNLLSGSDRDSIDILVSLVFLTQIVSSICDQQFLLALFTRLFHPLSIKGQRRVLLESIDLSESPSVGIAASDVNIYRVGLCASILNHKSEISYFSAEFLRVLFASASSKVLTVTEDDRNNDLIEGDEAKSADDNVASIPVRPANAVVTVDSSYCYSAIEAFRLLVSLFALSNPSNDSYSGINYDQELSEDFSKLLQLCKFDANEHLETVDDDLPEQQTQGYLTLDDLETITNMSWGDGDRIGISPAAPAAVAIIADEVAEAGAGATQSDTTPHIKLPKSIVKLRHSLLQYTFTLLHHSVDTSLSTVHSAVFIIFDAARIAYMASALQEHSMHTGEGENFHRNEAGSVLLAMAEEVRGFGKRRAIELLETMAASTAPGQDCSLLFLVQEELCRLKGRKWSAVRKNVPRDVISFLKEINYTNDDKDFSSRDIEDRAPISQVEKTRRKVQSFILIRSLYREILNMARTCNRQIRSSGTNSNNDAEAAGTVQQLLLQGSDLVTLNAVDSIFENFTPEGMLPDEFREGLKIDMRGRKFLDVFLVPTAHASAVADKPWANTLTIKGRRASFSNVSGDDTLSAKVIEEATSGLSSYFSIFSSPQQAFTTFVSSPSSSPAPPVSSSPSYNLSPRSSRAGSVGTGAGAENDSALRTSWASRGSSGKLSTSDSAADKTPTRGVAGGKRRGSSGEGGGKKPTVYGDLLLLQDRRAVVLVQPVGNEFRVWLSVPIAMADCVAHAPTSSTATTSSSTNMLDVFVQSWSDIPNMELVVLGDVASVADNPESSRINNGLRARSSQNQRSMNSIPVSASGNSSSRNDVAGGDFSGMKTRDANAGSGTLLRPRADNSLYKITLRFQTEVYTSLALKHIEDINREEKKNKIVALRELLTSWTIENRPL